MKNSDMYGLLAAVWIAPVNPDWLNIVIAVTMVIMSFRAFRKED